MKKITVLALSLFMSACSVTKLPDNLSRAMLNQDDPEVVADGAPAYLLMLDALILTYPENERFLLAGAQLYGAYAGVFAGLLFADNSEFRMELNHLPAYYDDKNSRGNGLYQYEGGHMVLFSYGTSTAKKFSTSIQFGSRAGMDTDISYIADFGFTYRPDDRFSMDFDLGFLTSENWYLHQGGTSFTSFDALQIRPGLAMDYFINANQQLRFSLQWIGIVAEENEFWQVPATPGRLLPRTKLDPSYADDFTVSQMTSQLRYRWEIAPLSDLFIVYTRGSNLPYQYDDDFSSLFVDAFNQPIIDTLTIKLRYRFSS